MLQKVLKVLKKLIKKALKKVPQKLLILKKEQLKNKDMNLDNRENYSPEDQYFQDDETRYEDDHQYDDIDIDAPPSDHSISDNAEPDYGNDFDQNEINNPTIDNENPGGDAFDEEFDDDDNDELDEEESYNTDEDLNRKDFNEHDESGTDPNRNR